MMTNEYFNQKLDFFSPRETLYYLTYVAQKKVSYTIPQLFVLSFQAGMFISMGALFAMLVSYGSPGVTDDSPGLKKLLYGAVFPVGLILIVLYGGELFTGNVMILPPAYLIGQISWVAMVRNLVVVYIGNFIGCLTMAYFIAHLSGLSQEYPFSDKIVYNVEAKVDLGFAKVFLRGIGCNFLVCLATYISSSSLDVAGKVLSIYFPTFTFSGVGFEHSIANMFIIPVGMLEGADISVGDFLVTSVLASTLGNIIGGGIFVGLAAWFVHTKADIFWLRSSYDEAGPFSKLREQVGGTTNSSFTPGAYATLSP